MSEVIEARNLTIGYLTSRKTTAVHQNMCFSLHAGELTCLLGANGSGKSTLLRTLAAAQPPLNGEILVNGMDISTMTNRQKSLAIGIVLTDKTQAGGLSVEELVSLGRQPHTGFFGMLSKRDHEVVDNALRAVGIANMRHRYVSQLSDGERQKAFIAKALVQECPIILLDEPTAFLDVVSRIEIMELLRHIAAQQHRAVLLSSHDIEQALALADRLWLLSPQNGLTTGVTEDLVLSGALDSLFINEGITFNYMSGSYFHEHKDYTPISVWAATPVLMHWCANALARHAFTATTCDNPEGAQLQVHSPTEIIIHGTQCHSFAQMLELLNT